MACSEPSPDPKFTAVSTQWPTAEEIQVAGRIRKANESLIARLSDPAQDVVGDLRLVRFLRARHMKENEATEWYAEFLKMRLDISPEIESLIRPTVIGMSPQEFMDWFLERVHPCMPISPWVGCTADKMGVFLGRSGMMDGVKFTEERGDIPLTFDKQLIIAFLEWTLWYLDEESHRQKRMLYVIKVMDMNGLGGGGRKLPIFVPKMKEFMTQLLEVMQKPYCEHDAMFIVLNAPFVFRMVFSVLSLILTAKQKAKFKLLGNTSDASVRKELLNLVPASYLPKELGGDAETVKSLYPVRDDSEIKAWIERIKTIELWPRRLGKEETPKAAAAADAAVPGAKKDEPAPSSTEASPTGGAVEAKCRSCGNTGKTFMGEICVCEYGKKLQSQAPLVEEAKPVVEEAVEQPKGCGFLCGAK